MKLQQSTTRSNQICDLLTCSNNSTISFTRAAERKSCKK